MNNIRGTIKGQTLSLYSSKIVADTRDYLTALFTFSADWEGRSIWAFFKLGEEIHPILLENGGMILANQHLNLKTGEYEVYLKGVKETPAGDGSTTTSRITTNIVNLSVERTGPMDGDPFPPVPPSMIDQIDAKVNTAVDTANNAKGIANEALNKVNEVEPWMKRAETAAENAEVSANNAKSAADISVGAASAAGNFADNAEASADRAAGSANAAGLSADKAKTSETNSGLSESNAYRSAMGAADSAKQAKAFNDAAKVSETNAKASEEAAKLSENAAKLSEDNSKQSEANAKGSEDSADADAQKAMQVLADLLKMLGTDIATLVNGKIPVDQIPSIATTEIFVCASQEEQDAITGAETGDILIRTDLAMSYIRKDTGWVYLVSPTDYAAKAGYAETAKVAENANMINNHRMVEMTKEAWETAVKDPSTYYLIYDPVSEV